MKDLKQLQASLKEHTILEGGGSEDDGMAAQLTYKGYMNKLRVVASWGGGWDHVSVSIEGRCPLWAEMCFVKDMFFHPGESVIQFHPPENKYVNQHPYCLHLWRPQEQEMPTPPLSFV